MVTKLSIEVMRNVRTVRFWVRQVRMGALPQPEDSYDCGTRATQRVVCKLGSHSELEHRPTGTDASGAWRGSSSRRM